MKGTWGYVHRIRTRTQYRYTFDDVIEITRLLRAYLLWRDRAPKTPLGATGIDFARAIIGVCLTLDYRWRPGYTREITERRLRAAGLDPVTWKIVDRRAAAWCWYQLKTTMRYSEKRQAALMASGEDPPQLEIPWTFPSDGIKKRVIEREQKKNLNQDFTRKIRERFE